VTIAQTLQHSNTMANTKTKNKNKILF